MSTNWRIVASCVGLVIGPNSAMAQSASLGNAPAQSSAQERHMSIILLEDFSQPGLAAVIRRTGGETGEDIIAIKRSELSPELVASAMASLSRAQTKAARPAGKSFIYFRKGGHLKPLAPETAVATKGLVSRLTLAGKKSWPGIDNVPALTLTSADLVVK